MVKDNTLFHFSVEQIRKQVTEGILKEDPLEVLKFLLQEIDWTNSELDAERRCISDLEEEIAVLEDVVNEVRGVIG